jgi:hypothetical protein
MSRQRHKLKVYMNTIVKMTYNPTETESVHAGLVRIQA